MKKTLIIALALVATSVPTHAAFACSPAPSWPPTATENLAQKDAAFIGTVKGIVQDKSVNGEYRITFAVNKTLKGSLSDTVTLRVQSSSAACGYDDGYTKFKEGNVWSIFATGNATDGYTTNSLSLNTAYDSVSAAEAGVAALGLTATASGPMIPAAPTSDLTIGSRGNGVIWLQQKLIAGKGGPAATALSAAGATGYFGTLTRAALAEYQAANGITPAQGYFGAKTRAAMDGTAIVPQVPQEEVTATTFTGKIEAVDTGCFADGICSVTVDGKKVIITSGLRVVPLPALGKLVGVDAIGDLEDKIGETARVFAAETTEGGANYTLYGSENYYVELVGDVPADGKITLRGTTECLPVKNPNGIHTMICALGLKGEDGNHYALHDTSADYDNVAGAQGDVEVKGTFTANTSSGYASIGTIDVTSIKEL